MKIGIVTRYCHHEATDFAIRIAQWAMARGHEVVILPIRSRNRVHPLTDCLLLPESIRTTEEWAGPCHAVVWTHTPLVEQIDWVKRHKKLSVMCGMWGEWGVDDLPALRKADTILCPFGHAADLAARCKATACVSGFSSGLPLMRPGIRVPPASILWPLHGGWGYRAEMTAIDVLGRVLLRAKTATATVLCSSSTLATYASARLRKLKRLFAGRLVLTPCSRSDDLAQHLLTHDLLYWPTHIENTGFLGLAAISCGLPLVAFDYPPLTSWFPKEVCYYARCGLRSVHMGTLVVDPDYEDMEQVLYEAVTTSRSPLQVDRGLQVAAACRKLFDDKLTEVLR